MLFATASAANRHTANNRSVNHVAPGMITGCFGRPGDVTVISCPAMTALGDTPPGAFLERQGPFVGGALGLSLLTGFAVFGLYLLLVGDKHRGAE